MKRQSYIFLGIFFILLLTIGYAHSAEKFKETTIDSISSIPASDTKIDSLKNKLQENTEQNFSIERRLTIVEKTLSNRIDSNKKLLENEILTKAESSVKYADFVVTIASVLLALFGVIVLTLGLIYYFNLRCIKREADDDLIKIKDLVKEGENIIATQKSIFRDFEKEARLIFDNANIPSHLISDDFSFVHSTPKSLSLGQEEKIEDIVIEALIYKSLLPKQNYELARVFIRIGHYFIVYKNNDEKAKIYYEYAIKVFKDDCVAYTCIGRLMIKQGNFESALIEFDKSIAIKNDYWLPYYDKGWIYDELGRYKEAIIEYKKALGFAPAQCVIPYNIACSYSKDKKQKEAYEYLKKSIDLSINYKHKAPIDKDLRALFQDQEFGPLATQLCK